MKSLTLLCLLTACSLSAQYQPKGSEATYVFCVKQIVTDQGLQQWKEVMDKNIEKGNTEASRFATRKISYGTLEEIKKSNGKSRELFVGFASDSIWRYGQNQNGGFADSILVGAKNGKLHFFDTRTKTLRFVHNLFDDSQDHQVITDRDDKKKILGYNTYKLILVSPTLDGEVGNTVYEMYVTDEIDMPAHALVNVNTLVKGFPLEARVYEDNFQGLEEHYTLVRVEQ